jgi:DivIVA domain-containing protein
MALLTADDVLSKKFQATKFREGYDQDEVDDFLDEVVTTLRAVQAENTELTDKLAAAERRIAELTRVGAAEGAGTPAPDGEQAADDAAAPVVLEKPVDEAGAGPAAPAAPAAARASEPESATGMLLLAQKLHDDHVRNGQQEGERLLSEAREQSTRIVREAEEASQRTLSHLEQERSLLERKIDELRVFERDYRTRLKTYLENLLGDLDNRGSALPPRADQAAGSPGGGL